MDVVRRSGRVPRFGHVKIQQLGARVIEPKRTTGRAIRFQVSRCTWSPSSRIINDVGAIEPIAFDCLSRGGGPRTFMAHGEFDAWIQRASVGGHAILRQLRPATGEQHFSYRVMRLLYQLAPRLRENLDRQFRRVIDLNVPRPARSVGEKDILPDSIGLAAEGDGHRWSIRHLKNEGRAAADDAGVSNPSDDQIIQFGLLAAARRQPIDVDQLSPGEASGLIRMAIFDYGPSAKSVEDGLTDEVISRLLEAIEKHKDDSTGDFHEWLFEKVDNLVHQVAKRKVRSGKIGRLDVRQVLIETVFKAFRYVGDCVDIQVKAFVRAFEHPLNAAEQAAYALLYEKQPYFGGLPLVLLLGQFGFAREAYLEMMNDPGNLRGVGTFLRVLQFHGEMVRKKRESERRYKQQRDCPNNRNLGAVALTGAMVRQLATSSQSNLFDEIAATLREQRGTRCSCRTTHEWFAQIDERRSKHNRVVIVDECATCGHRESVRTTVQAIRDLRADI